PGRFPHQRARQLARLLQDLKAVANTQHQAAAVREVGDRLHHGREAGNSAAAQVVAIREAAGKDDQLQAVDTLLPMIDVAHGFLEDIEKRVGTIPVTPRAGEDYDSRPQEPPPRPERLKRSLGTEAPLAWADGPAPATTGEGDSTWS